MNMQKRKYLKIPNNTFALSGKLPRQYILYWECLSTFVTTSLKNLSFPKYQAFS